MVFWFWGVEGNVRTGEHGNLVDVLKIPISFPLEASPEVCDEDLGALVEMHRFAFEGCFVTEAWEVFDEDVDEGGSRAGRLFNAGCEAAVETLGA